MTISDKKALLRRAVSEGLSALSEKSLSEKSARITNALQALPEYEGAQSIFVFIAVQREPDTRALIENALLSGKTVAVPLTYPGGKMSLRVIKELSELVPGLYGIPVPPETAPEVSPEDIDLAVIPAVAYDKGCRRLGRGGGYYDRFLSGFRGFSVGICFSECTFFEIIPCEEHDEPVCAVVTDAGVYRNHNKCLFPVRKRAELQECAE